MPKSPDLKQNKTIAQLLSDTRKPKLLPETGWYRVADDPDTEGFHPAGQYTGGTDNLFVNSWENVGGDGVALASWYLSQNGETRARGKVTGGEEGTVIFIFPEECRPQYAETFILAVDGGGFANVTVYPTGEVYVDSITA